MQNPHGGSRKISFLTPHEFNPPVDSHTCQTPWSVFQDGSNGEPTSHCLKREGAKPHRLKPALPTMIKGTTYPKGYIESIDFNCHLNQLRPAPRVVQQTSLPPFHVRPRHITGPHSLPSRQFQALFDSLFKVLFIFPSRYLFAIGLSQVFSLGRNLPPDLGCNPKQPDSPTAPHGATGSELDGAFTLSDTPFQGT